MTNQTEFLFLGEKQTAKKQEYACRAPVSFAIRPARALITCAGAALYARNQRRHFRRRRSEAAAPANPAASNAKAPGSGTAVAGRNRVTRLLELSAT